MDVILGIGVAGGLGLADFFGGMAGRRTGPVRTVAGAQIVGGVIIGIYLLVTWQPLGGTREILLALLAGGVLTLGVGFMYTGFTWGRMAVVAPVTAALIAILTFVVGLVRGERPSSTRPGRCGTGDSGRGSHLAAGAGDRRAGRAGRHRSTVRVGCGVGAVAGRRCVTGDLPDHHR